MVGHSPCVVPTLLLDLSLLGVCRGDLVISDCTWPSFPGGRRSFLNQRLVPHVGCQLSRPAGLQRGYYNPSILLICFIWPTLVPWYCWGETFRHSLYVATFLQYTVVLNVIWLVNSAAHLYGYHPYDKNIEAHENVLLSLGTLGEGFHNYHHIFPYDYSASEYHWSFNFTTFFVDCMAAIGLAYDLKKVPKASMLARIKRTGDGSYKSG
ncbi:PREDICTED: acyl-CoA desaturase 1-like [Dipodomys ordii]|uniref:stearoyl-CoA 9-desaturase n=1 Tax=Dipodomys ordii TaxID=10020 RepID=A0A1S3FAI2_DIPOR|nr:PREDICTED: acyl-CoA desaturase 1-like [Dipodomys ordii]